jgi:nucleoid DNA-binding protein
MTLNKQKMVREIGRRTHLTNREVQEVVEALVDVWTEELVAGGRIEVQNFIVLETKLVDRGESTGKLLSESNSPRFISRVTTRASKHIRRLLSNIPPPND